MAAGFNSPFFLLGYARSTASAQGFGSAHFIHGVRDASLVVTPDGFRSVLDFWIGGVGENPTASGGWWHQRFVRGKS